MNEPRGLLDTSVLIAREVDRPLDTSRLPQELCVSVVTVAELRAGVLAAPDLATRSRRLSTMDVVASLNVLTIDAAAAHAWAEMRLRLAEARRRVNVNDLWIASVAVANGLPVVTQDDDYDPLQDLGGPRVIHV